MSKSKFLSYSRTIALVIILLLSIGLTFNHVSQTTADNAVKLAETNYETTNETTENDNKNETFELNVELKDITIKENEKYNINDFIKEEDKSLLENITYLYKDNSMNNIKTKGKYEITLIFRDTNNNEIEKNATLTIEQKIEQTIKSNTTSTTTKKTTNISPKKTTEEKILEEDKKLGTFGRIYFSSLYSVALYRPTTSEQAQAYVDNKDSAAYYKYGNIMIVADHAYQGFTIIKSLKAGDYVYIKKRTGTGFGLEKYIVREKTNGKNTGYNLITDDGRDIGTDVNNSLALYTCNTADGLHVTIVLLDKAE